MGRGRERRYEEEERKSSREETDSSSWGSECRVPIHIRSRMGYYSNFSATDRHSSSRSSMMCNGKMNLLYTCSLIFHLRFQLSNHIIIFIIPCFAIIKDFMDNNLDHCPAMSNFGRDLSSALVNIFSYLIRD